MRRRHPVSGRGAPPSPRGPGDPVLPDGQREIPPSGRGGGAAKESGDGHRGHHGKPGERPAPHLPPPDSHGAFHPAGERAAMAGKDGPDPGHLHAGVPAPEETAGGAQGGAAPADAQRLPRKRGRIKICGSGALRQGLSGAPVRGRGRNPSGRGAAGGRHGTLHVFRAAGGGGKALQPRHGLFLRRKAGLRPAAPGGRKSVRGAGAAVRRHAGQRDRQPGDRGDPL